LGARFKTPRSAAYAEPSAVLTERRSVDVFADWHGLPACTLMGTLHAPVVRGKEVFSFEYDAVWLAAASSHQRTPLDPALRLAPGPQFVSAERANFGLFLDSSPDRWGRVLMQRREAHRARDAKRKERRFLELDYLLGVYDGHRLGALRFRHSGAKEGPYLDDDAELASPPWTSLAELEQASLHLERDPEARDPRNAAWLRLLIAPGRSLGGARPKASVRDRKQRLWIAKFPSHRDAVDVGAWEHVVARLAERAGIDVAESRCQRFAAKHHTFLTRRFDRTASGARLHFASAMTLLERSDGEEGASYLDLAQVLIRSGASPERDLEQLWRRMVFYVCVSNVDDHLRNHGFILERRGWRLSPAYDMNAVASGDGLTLNISETDNAQDLDLLRQVAPIFRVKSARAKAIVEEVCLVVRTWPKLAKSAGLSRTEQEQLAPAFRVAVSKSSIISRAKISSA
jgi:serine/threonine-protein kinase HipA